MLHVCRGLSALRKRRPPALREACSRGFMRQLVTRHASTRCIVCHLLRYALGQLAEVIVVNILWQLAFVPVVQSKAELCCCRVGPRYDAASVIRGCAQSCLDRSGPTAGPSVFRSLLAYQRIIALRAVQRAARISCAQASPAPWLVRADIGGGANFRKEQDKAGGLQHPATEPAFCAT